MNGRGGGKETSTSYPEESENQDNFIETERDTNFYTRTIASPSLCSICDYVLVEGIDKSFFLGGDNR